MSASSHSSHSSGDGGALAPLIVRRKQEDSEFDITAMVDLVFLMNLYFLVAFITSALGEINLPAATHVAPLDGDTAVVLTLIGTLDGKGITVFLADGEKGDAVSDADAQEEAVKRYVEKGVADGKKNVLIKAEKKVRLRELFRISSAAALEGVKLHVAVTEKDAAS
jgi:biopolymer transport protein ExbD